MSGTLISLAFSEPLSPAVAIATAVDVGDVLEVYRMGIELSRVPRRDAVPAVRSVSFSNSG